MRFFEGREDSGWTIQMVDRTDPGPVFDMLHDLMEVTNGMTAIFGHIAEAEYGYRTEAGEEVRQAAKNHRPC